ncbi:serine/threonine protein kinase SAK1 [Nakaseomyces bracarensis]|uniref:serine/threonine protein kinase SAK1 n=1 Tax=Nakaseomyces bracarensis TaxID=273131 RepID=UPI003872544A
MSTNNGDIIEEVDIPANLQLELVLSSSNKDTKNDTQVTTSSTMNSSLTNNSPIRKRFDELPEGLSASSSSLDSLNMLLERQMVTQLNHPQHQEHLSSNLVSGLAYNAKIRQHPKVKETNRIKLTYDPVSKRKVLNTYEIIRELGHGQHGKVKLGRDLVSKQLVAIKIVDRHEKKEKKFFSFRKPKSTENDKIKREIAIMKKCQHRHVVRLLEVLDDMKSRKIYLVLEYCAKGEVKWCPPDCLETEAKGPSPLSFQVTREILRGVVLGLEYLHYQGIIHRDIKPANLLIADDGTVKISDFGVSFAASSSDVDGSDDTIDELELAKTAGTPAFFAPEICLGEDAFETFQLDKQELFKGSCISFMIDIWALGITLYCLLFGKLPYKSEFELELFEKIVNDPIEFPSYEKMLLDNKTLNMCGEGEYEAAKDLVTKLLEKNPSKRINIPNIKRHPFVTWDFDHLTGDSEQELAAKLEDKFNFQSDQRDYLKQISITKHELKNAVSGVGKKIKESELKSISYRENASSDQSFDMEKFCDTRDKDNSIIVSEGSILKNMKDLRKSFSRNVSSKRKDISKKIRNKQENPKLGNIRLEMSDDDCSVEGDLEDAQGTSFSDTEESSSEMLSQKEQFERDMREFEDKHQNKNVVNLPINSSFASLDSFYIDNFALTKMGMDNDVSNHDQKISSSTSTFTKFQLGTNSGTSTPNPQSSHSISNQGNMSRNPSSHMLSYSLGMTSTRNDRVPRNHSISPHYSSGSSRKSRLQLSEAIPSKPRASTNTNEGDRSRSSSRNTHKTNFNEDEDGKSHGVSTKHNTDKGICKPSGGKSSVGSFSNDERNESPLMSLQERVKASNQKSEGFTVKRGNFFDNFNGEDDSSSRSSVSSESSVSYSDVGTSEASYSSESRRDTETESLPFEFGIDSGRASVVSLRDVPQNLGQVRPFLDIKPNTGMKKEITPIIINSDSESDSGPESDSDEGGAVFVLRTGNKGHMRRQNSYQNEKPFNDSSSTITPRHENPRRSNFGIQSRRGKPVTPSSSTNTINDGKNFTSNAGSLFVSDSRARPITQTTDVYGSSSGNSSYESPHPHSRDLLKDALLNGNNGRRGSIPLGILGFGGGSSGDKIDCGKDRPSRTAERVSYDSEERHGRSKSVSIARPEDIMNIKK